MAWLRLRLPPMCCCCCSIYVLIRCCWRLRSVRDSSVDSTSVSTDSISVHRTLGVHFILYVINIKFVVLFPFIIVITYCVVHLTYILFFKHIILFNLQNIFSVHNSAFYDAIPTYVVRGIILNRNLVIFNYLSAKILYVLYIGVTR